MTRTYVIDRPDAAPVSVPTLDPSQQAVVDHAGGPLLVLAGPGTGKTTTLIEAVVERIERRGLSPDQVLVLTFSRKAADELKARIASRLGRTTGAAPAMTFHSFCYGLVREFQDPEAYAHPLRLLSAPERDAAISELLSGSLETRRVPWPDSVLAALRTRGFARELQSLMDRARSLGMGPDELRDVAVASGRADWEAAAAFFEEYLDVSGFDNSTDYSEVVHRALDIVNDPDHRRALRDRYRLVVVDEYQDTDPLQVRLLKGLAGDGRDLIAVGDPDQSIYAFRGADVSGILDFPHAFATADGQAPVLALTSTRRFGPQIARASGDIISKVGVVGGLDKAAFEAFRKPAPLGHAQGEVIVQTFATPAAEAEHIAQMLRRAHLEDGVPWTSIAVLVRSGMASIPRLQRALIAAGVPVEVAGDEVPLAAEPAVRTLLGALIAADCLAQGDLLEPDHAEALLTGPLCGLDASAMRRLGRALRACDAGMEGGPRPSRTLIAEALGEQQAFLMAADDPRTIDAARRAQRLADLLRKASVQISGRTSPEEVLWTLWSGTAWSVSLRELSEGGGDSAQRADRDLDALCALFDQAARAEERHERRGVRGFVDSLAAQDIPADTLFDRGNQHDAVRLMTAHRSKGLEWDLVVVAGVQEGQWPDIRYRGSFLQSDRLGTERQQHSASAASLLAEERRLFYVAITRARRRLVVTAVQSASETGDQPSRFVGEIERVATTTGRGGPDNVRMPRKRPAQTMSLRGMIARLRGLAESSDSELVRSEVASRLAHLAALDLPATRAAHPDRWWGVRDITVNDTPLRVPGDPIRLSGSGVSAITLCPLNWFLAREARGGTATTTAQGFGSMVHALAAEVVQASLPADPVILEKYLDSYWDQLGFAAPWISVRERQAASEAIVRFASWHEANPRTPLAAEHPFEVELTLGGSPVILRGSMDRVEVAKDGTIHVVDFKTSKSAAAANELATHSQLGFYQVATDNGAVDELLGRTGTAGGAELVQLRIGDGTRNPNFPKVQPQDPAREGEPFFALEEIIESVRTISQEDFAATPSVKACQYCEFTRVCPTKPQGTTVVDREVS